MKPAVNVSFHLLNVCGTHPIHNRTAQVEAEKLQLQLI